MIDFGLIIPDGWVHIPTTPEFRRVRERTIDAIVRHALPDTLPRDKAGPWRRMLRRELTEATDEAEQQGARAVVLPVREMHGMRLPGTLLLSVIEDVDSPQDPKLVLDALLADAGPDGMALEIGGCPAVRIRQVVDSRPIKRTAPAVRVNYYVAAPDAPGVWGVLTFTVLSDGDVDAEPVQAIVLLFDAVVSTLRWTDNVDIPTEDELLGQLSGN
ncbi:hypothetical protein [Micromonospora sp. HM5-17]|jgi:hypothetical protein|uniref:hypothetical protein n=1 Tax=Micromonospora sp. HM5-17 TaxID=2487710 RepID=UPI000F493847|nr:hypothetical protein [Micromonospora sp. HM5-17]ROT33425.1 hypothetical protein EF879_00030 [Micromonospora sp. HM5-17]